MFLTQQAQCLLARPFLFLRKVAIPSNRVNVSYPASRIREAAREALLVAIPSNRVNVSYLADSGVFNKKQIEACRNPLKSGQCFLRILQGFKSFDWSLRRRNPLKSGQCFLHNLCGTARKGILQGFKSQSPQIGSMFLTWKDFSYFEKTT